MDENRFADGLGAFSIVLGAVEVVTPGGLGAPIGLGNRQGILRAFGLREIAAGIGILTSRRKAPWIWGRVAGDVLDLAVLTMGLSRANPKRGRAAIALGIVAAITALDFVVARELDERGG